MKIGGREIIKEIIKEKFPELRNTIYLQIKREQAKCFQIFKKKNNNQKNYSSPYQELRNRNQSVIGFLIAYIRC